MDPAMTRTTDRVENIKPVGVDLDFFDLSVGGVCCRHGTSLRVGSAVKVKVSDLVIEARVAHTTERTDGFRIGLQFSNVTPDLQKKLNDVVDGYSKGMPVACGIVGEKSDKKVS